MTICMEHKTGIYVLCILFTLNGDAHHTFQICIWKSTSAASVHITAMHNFVLVQQITSQENQCANVKLQGEFCYFHF